METSVAGAWPAVQAGEGVRESIPGPDAITGRDAIPAVDLHCRVCELEVENARLRLLVGELLVANQRLREGAQG